MSDPCGRGRRVLVGMSGDRPGAAPPFPAFIVPPLAAAAGIGYLAAAYPPPPGRSTTPRILHTLALYAAAVAGDRLDRPVYWLTLRAVSGHTLKHLLAGAAGWQLVRMLGET